MLTVIDTWLDGDVSRPVNDVQKSALERLREVFASLKQGKEASQSGDNIGEWPDA